jgi:hypothetical protein
MMDDGPGGFERLFEPGGDLLAGMGLGSLLGEPSWLAPAPAGGGAGPASFAGFLRDVSGP